MIEREQVLLREFQEQLKKSRILQARALEKRVSAQRVQKYAELAHKKKQSLIRQLKHEWEEDRRMRLSRMEEECSIAFSNIGNSHLVAARLEKDKISSEKAREAYAQEQHFLEWQRYKQALQKVLFHKELIDRPQRVANKRRKTKEIAACFERSLARFTSHALGTRAKPSQPVSATPLAEMINPPKLAGFKHTYFHSSLAPTPDPEVAEAADVPGQMNAWRAAAVLKKALERHKERQAEINQVLRRRVTLRGQAAASRVFMRKRIEKLQRELEIVQRREAEKRQHLLYAVPRTIVPEIQQDTNKYTDDNSDLRSEEDSQMQKETSTQTDPELGTTVPEALEVASLRRATGRGTANIKPRKRQSEF